MQIQELEMRDQDFDRQLDQIGEGILDLAEIAEQQGEEVRRQNVMIDNATCVLFCAILCVFFLQSDFLFSIPQRKD